MDNTSRNTTIDIIKGFACIAVVWIHYCWSNDAGVFMKTISRFAVPFFFFVSGYYLPDRHGQITPDNIRRKIVHIVDITWKGGMFYLFFCVAWNMLYAKSWSMAEYIAEKVTKANVFEVNSCKRSSGIRPFLVLACTDLLLCGYGYAIAEIP